MMIEGADRFGLAQLHQFRGRVGRGAAESHCLLLADDPSAASLERLKLVETISDGFRLAREDMERRGIGELMGSKQHGMSDAAMDALRKPLLLDEVRDEAQALLLSDPRLEAHPLLRDAVEARLEKISIS
jgi:ATP-dependent DNA helicase RecG